MIEGKDPSNGRFVKGNKLGHGNPLTGQMQEFRELFLKSVSKPKFKKVVKKLMDKALKGDVACIKLLIERVMGKIPDGASISVTNGNDGKSIIEIKVDNADNADNAG